MDSDGRTPGGPEGTTGSSSRRPVLLAFGALGIVYGDIGTSPLYALRESFEGAGLAVDEANVLGILSLILWSLIVVISIKYLAFVMRADNEGEGGILVLASLLPSADGGRRRALVLRAALLLGLFGTALLYGDGVITPAISVLAAMEGTAVVAPGLARFAVPAAVVILVLLFSVQHRGTGSVSRAFGPVMLVWFTTIGVLGVVHVVAEPSVLAAVNPLLGMRFLVTNAGTGIVALGSVFLVVTGGEALYADLGHFGRTPIAIGWFAVVLPGLVANYFGQGALLLADPSAIDAPFYRLAPSWASVPLVVLATLATIIASQALISGAFSLTMQAVRLGYLPRVEVVHTSATERGQIYVPVVNWALMLVCVGLVVGFGSSSALAAAYGIAVTMTMVITTLLFAVIARERFGWSRARVVAMTAVLLVVDLAFTAANVPKIPNGGWFPLVVGGGVMLVMTTWFRGRQIVRRRSRRGQVPLDEFLASLMEDPPARVQGTAVHLFGTVGVAPPSLVYDVRSDHVLHEDVVVVTVVTDPVPTVLPARRERTRDVGHGVRQVELHYGFMQQPQVAHDLRDHLGLDLDEAVFFLGREKVVVVDRPDDEMAAWREHLFALLRRNARDAADSLGLPNERVFELAVRIEL